MSVTYCWSEVGWSYQVHTPSTLLASFLGDLHACIETAGSADTAGDEGFKVQACSFIALLVIWNNSA